MSGGPLSPALASRAEALPAGAKLLALMAAATVLLVLSSPWAVGAAAGLAAALALLAVGWRRLRAATPYGVIAGVAIVALFTLAMEGPLVAAVALMRLSALILLAQVVTETTRASAIQDALVAALRPFERLPFVSAEKAGLGLAIALRSLPRIGAALHELREARQARGLRPGPLRLVVPLIARVLPDARETADAIDARSWTGTKARTDDHA